MRRSIRVVLAGLSGASCLAADRPPPPALAPLGPWVVEAETDTCLVQRSYGTPEQRVMVALQPVFNLQTLDVIVVTTQAHPDQRIGDAKLTPGPNGATITGSYSSVAITGKPQRFTRITTDRALLDALGTAETLAIRAKPVDVRIRLTSFAKAMKTFDACRDGLLRSWGVDPASVVPERAPKPRNVLTYFRPEDYPAEAQRSGIIGRVLTVLQVDATGKVTNCRITASAGAVLNAGTCRQALKVRFEPGTDAEGQPTPSVYVLPVRWCLGSDCM